MHKYQSGDGIIWSLEEFLDGSAEWKLTNALDSMKYFYLYCGLVVMLDEQ